MRLLWVGIYFTGAWQEESRRGRAKEEYRKMHSWYRALGKERGAGKLYIDGGVRWWWSAAGVRGGLNEARGATSTRTTSTSGGHYYCCAMDPQR